MQGKLSWWRFVITKDYIDICTPLFAIFIADYCKDFISYGYWRGFELFYSPNRFVKLGEYMFNKSIKLYTDYILYFYYAG